MAFNENTRVKIPAILHLMKLGYKYLSLKDAHWDHQTNIFTDIFFDATTRLNPGIEQVEIKKRYYELLLALDNDDLGEKFYKLLLQTDIKVIDCDDFSRNSLNVVTELTYKNGDDEFRPDITVLVNGLPLAFIEVKKPNNHEGIIAERNRMDTRFRNSKFKRFINATQLLVFSNNMEYDTEAGTQYAGAYYSSTSTKKAIFHAFREDGDVDVLDLGKELKPISEEQEAEVLDDNNLVVVKYNPEFNTNKDINTPTNRILTSLFSSARFPMLLKYGIAYVREHDGIHKHIMRYPQYFAMRAIERRFDQGGKKGVIWHTQGSGKTALSFYSVRFLADYYQKKQVIPKFYFIVDRIDLLIQAKKEFTARGLIVHTANSKDELMADFRTIKAIHNYSGQHEITVVNIQKFAEDTETINETVYNVNTQRIYFLDEVHRSYDPKGNYLANLISSDRTAVIVGLTGTPLLAEEKSTKALFGEYIHKYYYNSSIADGYTLKLIREGIETGYKDRITNIIKDIEVVKGDASKSMIYSHRRFVEAMLEYIINDFRKSRIALGDSTIGGMIVCDSSDQAKCLYGVFQEKYSESLTAALILHDIGSKDERKDEIEKFKEGGVDFLIVYNMLLTGFDAKRLKKLYLGRIIKRHNLLQTLTRVNRPYKDFKYGYVVDFADITKEFDATNKAYFEELQLELGDEVKWFSSLFLTKEEMESEISNIKETLFRYDMANVEEFTRQINEIENKAKILEIKNALVATKEMYNMIRLLGHYELINKVENNKITALTKVASDRYNLLRTQEIISDGNEGAAIINLALEDVLFTFTKISEEEMLIADQVRTTVAKTREEFNHNFDHGDPEFVRLADELTRVFKKINLRETAQSEMRENIVILNKVQKEIKELNRRNNLLKAKFKNDEKFARVHKRIIREKKLDTKEYELAETLTEIKSEVDKAIGEKQAMVNNEAYFTRMIIPILINKFQKHGIKLDSDAAIAINQYIANEYLEEYRSLAV